MEIRGLSAMLRGLLLRRVSALSADRRQRRYGDTVLWGYDRPVDSAVHRSVDSADEAEAG